jgi:hypothetical protein
VALAHPQTIGHMSRQSWLQQHPYYVLTISVNGASTTIGLESLKMQRLCGNINTLSNDQTAFYAKI